MIENFANCINDKNKNYIIFDVGSRDCQQSIEFYKTFPNAKIYAFECNPNTLGICEQNIVPYQDRITLIKGAVCDYDGDINCHRLDTIMNEYKIPSVDIIWMDLQGAEVLALKGLGNKLSSVEYIHVEVSHQEIYTNQTFPEFHNYLTNYFSFKKLNNSSTSYCYENKFTKDPLYTIINLSLHQQIYERGKPKEYLLHTIKLLNYYTNAKTILEIGSIRKKMNHDITDFNSSCCNDGHSTYFFKHYTNAEIFTVDIDKQCKKIIDSDVRLNGVNATSQCGFEYAENFKHKIDLLYLDAWDVCPGSPYAQAHLDIYNKLKNNLSDDCLILIDDTDVGNGGKGKLIIPQLIKDGFLMIFNKRQTLFSRINYCEKELIKQSIVSEFLFDIVIPVGPNDKSIIEEQIKYTKQNIIGYRNIYLICYDPSIEIDGCTTINENIFPFNIDTVASHHGKLERNGWYLQQLLKLYSGQIIPGILDRYLVIDSDTFFLKPTIFVENDKCLYNYGIEYHKPYFEHMKKMDKNLIKVDAQKSGICHHMIFEKKYVDEMISLIEKNHNDLFYKVFLQFITEKSGAGASEYEMYFNYMLKYNPDKIKLRRLNWKNTNKLDINNNLDYISYHWYMRK